MKILFIENRSKTHFYERIADELKKEHSIIFLNYNKVFKANNYQNILLQPLYKKNNIKRIYTKEIKKITDADRGLKFFNVKRNEYIFSYKLVIDNILERIKPDIIFGESTLFYEQLVINWAKRNNTLYLHPTSNRYPPNRLVFYQYDSMKPFGGSEERLSENEYLGILDKIKSGSLKPEYTKLIKQPIFTKIKYYVRITIGNVLFDKYMTPSIGRKWFLEKRKKKNIETWDNFAFDDFLKEQGLFYILYPLQMQPEMNIDYWGYPNFDQVKILKKLIQLTDDNIRVIIKPNPKSKYEMSQELIKLMKSSYRFIPLAHSVKMSDIFNKVDLVVTNTGTISLECFFSGKPCLVFGKFDNEFLVQKDLNDINKIITQIKNRKYEFPCEDDKINFLKYSIKNSYPGTIGDPVSTPDILRDENIELVNRAFSDVLNKHAS